MFARRTATFCLTVAVIATTAALSGCGGAQARFASHMHRGRTYFDAGQFSKAGVEFGNALQIEPKDPQAALMAGRTAEHLGRPRNALGLYQSVIDAQPGNLEARAALAGLMVKGRAPSQALKIIQPGLQQAPNDVALLTLRAVARSQQNDMAGAIADAERALQLQPGYEAAVEVRAGLYRDAGDLAAAEKLVREGTRHAPGSRALHEMLADLESRSGHALEAAAELRTLIALAPQELTYRYQLASLYSRAHELDQAQRVLDDSVQALPDNDEAKLMLVDFLDAQRSHAVAEQTLRGFVARAPANETLRLGLGALLERAGAQAQALEVYRDVIQREDTRPSGLIARDRIARIEWTQGHAEDARKLVAEVLHENSHDNDALALRGEMELASADLPAAITDLRAVLRDHPESIGLRRLIARAYLANGQPALAEEALHAALDVAPGDVGSSIQLAQLMQQTRRPDQAVKVLEDEAQRVPNDAVVRTELARAYLNRRDFTAAYSAAQVVQTLRPDIGTGLYLEGMADLGLKRPQQAQGELERALAVEPHALDVLTALARLELATGQASSSIALVQQAMAKDRSNALLPNLLGELYLQQKNWALATDAFRQATAVAPKWWVPYRNVALTRVAAGDSPGAIAAYQSAMQLAPGEPTLATELTRVYETQGHPDDAISVCEVWHQHNPRSDGVSAELALLLVAYRHDRASLDRALDLTSAFASSNEGGLLDANGWVHFKRGEYTQALPLLQRALERSPDSKQILYHLGMAELRVGQTERARGDLEAALSGSAKFHGVDEARAALASLNGSAS